MRVSSALPVTAVAAVAVAVAAAAAAAQSAPRLWTTPTEILRPPARTGVGAPAIAFTASGRGLVTWNYDLANGHTGQRATAWRGDAALDAGHDLRSFIEPPLVYKRDRAFALLQNRSFAQRRVRVVFGSTSGRFGAEQTIYTSRLDAQSTKFPSYLKPTQRDRG